MGLAFATKYFLPLLLLLCAHAGNLHATLQNDDEILPATADDLPTEVNVLRLPSMRSTGDNSKRDAVHASPSSSGHMHHLHMNPVAMVFFTIDDLVVGKRLPVYFPKKDMSKVPHFLPREEAESIPFSYKDLPYLLQLFSFPQGSLQAQAMEDTLSQCELKPIIGETKFCATSLESMLDFVGTIFGPESFKAVTTNYISKSSTLLQNYTISGMAKEIPAQKMVACHTVPYAYAVFYCHSQESENRVFMVSLVGDNGDMVEAVAVCHMDTSHWSPDHVSFKVVGVEPGFSGICHFFPEDNLVYVPVPIMM